MPRTAIVVYHQAGAALPQPGRHEAATAARGGRLGFNVTLLLEMGEEAGLPSLRALCEQQRNALRSDLLIACDGPRASAARPTLFLGSRGAFNFTLRYRARERAYHSGNWGGVLANAATVLSHAIASQSIDMAVCSWKG